MRCLPTKLQKTNSPRGKEDEADVGGAAMLLGVITKLEGFGWMPCVSIN
jgi:hypothetical protein